jgi:hypothetical protein
MLQFRTYLESVLGSHSDRGLGSVAALDCAERKNWIVDGHRDDGKRFVVQADDKLTAFLEFEAAISGTRFQGGGANQVRLSFVIPSTTGRVWQVQTTCSILRCLISSTLNRYSAAPGSLLTARDEVLQRAFRSSVPTFDTR